MALFCCCYCTAIYCCFVLPVTFHFVQGCSPVQEAPGLRQNLQGLDEIMSVTNFAILDLTTMTQRQHGINKTLRRAVFGSPYILDTESEPKLHFQNNFSVIWEHNDRPLIFSKMGLDHLTNDSSNTFALTVFEDSFELLFYNITPATIGKHKLIINEGHGELLYSTTYVRLRWNFTSVFYRPMENATVSTGETVHLRCYAHVVLGVINISERVIWRYGSSVLHAPKSHRMATLIDRDDVARNYAAIILKDGDHTWSIVLTIKSVDLGRTGRYECWFQPDPGTDEWLVQSAYLHLK